MDTKIKVLICEDKEPLRKRYRAFLESDPEILVAGDAANGYDASLQAALLHPDIILMDVNMEYREAGIDAARQILLKLPEMRVVVLTSYADDDLIFKAFQAGILNYILKDDPLEDVLRTIKDTYYGRGISLSPLISNKLLQEFSRIKNYHESLLLVLHRLMLLTTSELEILNMLIDGRTRSEICEKRCVEITTIKTQIHDILRKMEMGYTREMVETITRLGLVDFIKSALDHNSP